jgi:hypothetical protein
MINDIDVGMWILSQKGLPRDMFNVILDHLRNIHICEWKHKISIVNDEYINTWRIKYDKEWNMSGLCLFAHIEEYGGFSVNDRELTSIHSTIWNFITHQRSGDIPSNF